jgi:glutathione S-transferase
MRWMDRVEHASMRRMNILYYSPRACSFAVHIVLEEIGAPFEARCASIPRHEHETPEFTKLNPLQRVPVLETEHGVLTEAAAILQYLARTHPEAGLLPADPELMRAQEWLNFLASNVHPAFAPVFHPRRFVQDSTSMTNLAAGARALTHQLLVLVAKRFGDGPWALGEKFSLVDPYLLVFLLWGRRLGIPQEGLETLDPFIERMLARPSVVRALATEQAAM